MATTEIVLGMFGMVVITSVILFDLPVDPRESTLTVGYDIRYNQQDP